MTLAAHAPPASSVPKVAKVAQPKPPRPPSPPARSSITNSDPSPPSTPRHPQSLANTTSTSTTIVPTPAPPASPVTTATAKNPGADTAPAPAPAPTPVSTPVSPAVIAAAAASSAGTPAAQTNTLAAATEPPAPRPFSAEDDESLSSFQLMAAGAMAGMTEHIAMFPVDTVKTRMQSYVALRDVSNLSMLHTTRSIVATGGIAALFRGVSAVAISAGPAHALYFATYERVHDGLQRVLQRRRDTATAKASAESGSAVARAASAMTGVSPVATMLAGTCATLACDGIMTPLDVVKQRMQISSGGGWYSNVFSCTRHVYENHGWRAFFAGYRATVVMNIPFTAVYFTGYEMAKAAILDWRQVDESQFSPSSHCIAGAVAGAMASGATTPLDVVKTRLQTQGEVGARRYAGMGDALVRIYQEEGMAGMFRGVRPRMLFHIPAAAVCWTTYEFCKHLMGRPSSRPSGSQT